jgi:hypothetical protein
MNSGMAKRIVPVVRTAAIAGCLVIGALGAAPWAWAQTPPSTPAPPTAMPPPQAPPVTPPLHGAVPKAAGSKPASAMAGASQASCEKYIAVLSGKSTDQALLKNSALQALAQAVPDLPTCGAVAADSDAICQALPASAGGGDGKDDDPRQSCRKSWAQFHELRKATGRPFVTEVELEECRSSKDMAASCNGIAEAFRTGDPKKCPSGAFQSDCQAAVSLDPSYCRADGPQAAERIKRCQQHIEQDRLLTKGLKAIAESGQPLDRQFAKAALGEADACAAFAASAMDVCTAGAAPAKAGAPGR